MSPRNPVTKSLMITKDLSKIIPFKKIPLWSAKRFPPSLSGDKSNRRSSKTRSCIASQKAAKIRKLKKFWSKPSKSMKGNGTSNNSET